MGREIEIEADPCIFEKKMENPQRYLHTDDWTSFKSFFQKDPKAILQSFDLAGNSVIQIAADNKQPQLVREFLAMLQPTDIWRALRRKNVLKSTVLHNNDVSVEIAEIILSHEKKLSLPPDNEIEADQQEEKELSLLELRNIMGETPIYRAAIDGNMPLLKHLVNKVTDLKNHFHREKDKTSILHAAVVAQHFDVALYLLKLDITLADQKDDNGCTCLQLLSNMPSVFKSGTTLSAAKKFIYYLLPDYRYYDDDDDDSTKVLIPRRDIESGQNKIKQRKSVLSRINTAIWNQLAKEWDGIKHIQEIKIKNNLAEQLADSLVSKDGSWQVSFIEKQNTPNIAPAMISSKVSRSVKQIKPNREKQFTKETTPSSAVHTPLLLAAASGIVEIVESILELHPQAINHVSEDELNILHVAVMYRQRKIFQIVKDNGAWKWLRARLSTNGNSLLHQAASMRFYKGRHESGIAYKLQDELRWYYCVEKIIPSYLILHYNEDRQTAARLFNTEHESMLKESKEWTKDTAQSCSTVAVLVATMVFAAAYAVPGGYDANGLPIFLGSPAFLFFTIMDVVGLASSLASVVMFLSILTSPFEIDEFRESIPRKLSLGFALLFFSLINTMLAFSATILLTIKLEKRNWTSTLIYSVAFFPVTVFGLFQFPFYVAAKGLCNELSKKIGHALPSRLKRSKILKVEKRKKSRKMVHKDGKK